MKKFRFVFMTDFHIGYLTSSILDSVVTEINTYNPNLVFIPGDLTADSLATEFDECVTSLNNLNCNWYAIPGNHDAYDDYVNWNNYIGQIHNATNYDNYLFVGFVTTADADDPNNKSYIETSELDYLETQLSLYPDHHKFIYSHYPYSTIQNGQSRLTELINSHNIFAFFNGHTHLNFSIANPVYQSDMYEVRCGSVYTESGPVANPSGRFIVFDLFTNYIEINNYYARDPFGKINNSIFWTIPNTYSSENDIVSLIPNLVNGASSLSELTYPQLYYESMASGYSKINAHLMDKGYLLDINSGCALHQYFADVEANFTAMRAEMSRSSPRVSAGERDRIEQFETAFKEGLENILSVDYTEWGMRNIKDWYVGGLDHSEDDLFPDDDRVKERFKKGAFDGEY